MGNVTTNTDGGTDVPVHDSLRVTKATDIYRNDEWWKAVVTYRFEDSETDETAVYLWHRDDDDWVRKNKYVVKTREAWDTDRQIIDRSIRDDSPDGETTEFPVSDYYTVAEGETIFQSDEWWKAIVKVVEKGSYETQEVMVYVWQRRDDDWRRRQKYAIKSVSDWEEDTRVLEDHLSIDDSTTETSELVDDNVSNELSTLDDELSSHLSEEFTDSE